MNVELLPIAEKKIRQMGGEAMGVVVRRDDGILVAVTDSGRVTRLDDAVAGPVRDGAQGAGPVAVQAAGEADEKGAEAVSQAELFPADPPARGIDHGGYMPGQTISWRGHEIPESYLFDWGFRTERLPTNTGLMDSIMESLVRGPASFRQLLEATGSSAFEVSKHLELMRSLSAVYCRAWMDEEGHHHEIGLFETEGANQ